VKPDTQVYVGFGMTLLSVFAATFAVLMYWVPIVLVAFASVTVCCAVMISGYRNADGTRMGERPAPEDDSDEDGAPYKTWHHTKKIL